MPKYQNLIEFPVGDWSDDVAERWRADATTKNRIKCKQQSMGKMEMFTISNGYRREKMAEELFEAGAEVLFEGAAYVIDAIVEGAAYLVSKTDGHIQKVDLNDLQESQEGLPEFPVTIDTFAHADKWSVFQSEDWDSAKFPADLAEKLGYLHYEVKFTTRIDANHCVTITHINDVPVSQEVSDALVQN